MFVPEPYDVSDLMSDTTPILAASSDLHDIDVVVLIDLVGKPLLHAEAVAAALISLAGELDIILAFPILCAGKLFEPDVRGALPGRYRLLNRGAVGERNRRGNDVRQEVIFPSFWLAANVVRHDKRGMICTSVQNVSGTGENDVSLHDSLIVDHFKWQGIALAVDLIGGAIVAAANLDLFLAAGGLAS